jgi:uncharacterized membrane protein
MSEPLHPSTLSEILDRTAQLYRSRFLVYFGIGAIPAGAVLVFAAACFVVLAASGAGSTDALANGVQAIAAFGVIGVLGLVAVPVCVAVTALGWAAMSIAASRTYLGEPITIRDVYKNAWARAGRFIGLYLLLALIVGALPVTAFLFAAPLTAAASFLARQSGFGAAAAPLLGVTLFLLFFAFTAFALWMLLCLSMAFPASVVEQSSPWSAIKRSYALSKGTRGRIFLLFLLGSALGWILALGISIPIFIAIALIPGAGGPQHAQMMGEIVMFTWYGLWFAVQAFTKPVYGIALTLFYFDQRIRNEGFDIEWMMQKTGLVPAPPLTPEATPWLPAAPPAFLQPAPPEPQPPALPVVEVETPSSGGPA